MMELLAMSTTASPFAALLHTPCPLAPSLCVGGGGASSLAELRAPALLTPTLGYLRQLLQTCVEIEHSTIPLYLTAAWSMDDNKSFAYNVTHGVAIEEMLHMTDAANLLNAIGGAPDIDQPSFVPRYPIVMPIINVSSSIASFSRRTYGTFEKIEVEGPAKTIATTYAYVADVLKELVAAHGEAAVFTGDPALQVNVTTRGGERTTVVTTLAAAVAALEGISDQGSGCPSPDPPGFNLSAGALGGGLAHFARFKEVLVGREYRTGDTVDSGPTGAAVAVDWSGVRRFVDDPRVEDFDAKGAAGAAARAFAGNYTKLLVALHAVFNGHPDRFMATVRQMAGLRRLADASMATHDPRFPPNATMGVGPTWQYLAEASEWEQRGRRPR